MHFLSCQYTFSIISNLFSIFTFLSAICRAERGTLLDEPPVDPLRVVETSITRSYYPRLVTLCSYGAVSTSYFDGGITARTRFATGGRPSSPEVITESPSHRARSPGLNMESIDREATRPIQLRNLCSLRTVFSRSRPHQQKTLSWQTTSP